MWGDEPPSPRRDHWIPDAEAPQCMDPSCETKFSFFVRRHHCRACGRVMCSEHCTQNLPLDASARFALYGALRRVCDECYAVGSRRLDQMAAAQPVSMYSATYAQPQLITTPAFGYPPSGAYPPPSAAAYPTMNPGLPGAPYHPGAYPHSHGPLGPFDVTRHPLTAGVSLPDILLPTREEVNRTAVSHGTIAAADTNANNDTENADADGDAPPSTTNSLSASTPCEVPSTCAELEERLRVVQGVREIHDGVPAGAARAEVANEQFAVVTEAQAGIAEGSDLLRRCLAGTDLAAHNPGAHAYIVDLIARAGAATEWWRTVIPTAGGTPSAPNANHNHSSNNNSSSSNNGDTAGARDDSVPPGASPPHAAVSAAPSRGGLTEWPPESEMDARITSLESRAETALGTFFSEDPGTSGDPAVRQRHVGASLRALRLLANEVTDTGADCRDAGYTQLVTRCDALSRFVDDASTQISSPSATPQAAKSDVDKRISEMDEKSVALETRFFSLVEQEGSVDPSDQKASNTFLKDLSGLRKDAAAINKRADKVLHSTTAGDEEKASAQRAADKAGDVQENLSELEFTFKKRGSGAARSAGGGRNSVGSSLLQETVDAKAPVPPPQSRPSNTDNDFFGL